MLLLRSTEFKKRFRIISKKLQRKIIERLEIFSINPFEEILNNHQLQGEYEGCRSINITGDFRLIYKKEGADRYVLLNIGTHGQLYE